MTEINRETRSIEEAARRVKFFSGWSIGHRPLLFTATELTGTQDTVEAYRALARRVEPVDIVEAVSFHEVASYIEGERKALAKVSLPGWSVPFVKTESGGWRGEGGNYDPNSEFGKRLEATLEEQESSKPQE